MMREAGPRYSIDWEPMRREEPARNLGIRVLTSGFYEPDIESFAAPGRAASSGKSKESAGRQSHPSASLGRRRTTTIAGR